MAYPINSHRPSVLIIGDHFIFITNGVEEIINLPPNMNKAKAYQFRKVINIIVKYLLNIE